MAKQPTNKVPPRKEPNKGTRPAPPRPPRKPAGRRRGGNRTRMYAGAGGAVVIAVVVILVIVLTSGGGGGGTKTPSAVNWKAGTVAVYGKIGPEGIPLQAGPQLAPANSSLTGSSVDGIGCDAGMSVAYHIHTHLTIFINGQPRSVPLAIGFPPPAQVVNSPSGYFAQGDNKCLYWLHTHAQDGIIHIESPGPATYRLGQFFDIWGQPLSANRIGPYTGPVSAVVNGKPWTGTDPAQILLQAHEQIVLNLGTPVVSPPPISWSGSNL